MREEEKTGQLLLTTTRERDQDLHIEDLGGATLYNLTATDQSTQGYLATTAAAAISLYQYTMAGLGTGRHLIHLLLFLQRLFLFLFLSNQCGPLLFTIFSILLHIWFN